MKMNLSLKFHDPYFEQKFSLSKLPFKIQNFLLFLSLLLLHFLELFCLAFRATELNQIIKAIPFMIAISFFIITILAGSWKFPKLARAAHAAAILFSSVYSTEFSREFQFESQIPHQMTFVLGLNLVALEILLVLTKVPWIQTVLITAGVNLYWWLRVRPEGYTIWMLILFFFQKTIITIFAYYQEREERKSFLQTENTKSQLKTYEEIMNSTIKNSMLFMKDDEVIFCNGFSKKNLGITSKKKTLEILHSIKIVRKGGLNEFLEDLEERSVSFSPKHSITLYELYKDCEAYLLDFEVGDSPGFNSVVAEMKDKEDTKAFVIQLGAASWNNETGVLIIINDISHIKSYYNALDTQKDSLLATVSHDLRAPLNGIMGMMSLALERIEDEECREDLKISMNSAKLMQHMINDILDFSLLSKGKLRLKFESTNICELVHETVKILSLQANMKGLSLSFESSINNSKENHIIDANRLRQVLFNLIGNAIKYTKAGKVVVRVKEEINEEVEEASILMEESFEAFGKTKRGKHVDLLEKLKVDSNNDKNPFPSFNTIDEFKRVTKTNGCGKLLFEVEDTGVGIKKEDLSKLFRLFSRVTAGHDDKMSGIGLGLAISQSLVMIMNSNKKGGKIEVKSTFGKGTLFRFPIFVEKQPSEIFKEVLDEKYQLPIFVTRAFDKESTPKADSTRIDTFTLTKEGDFLLDKNENKRVHLLVVDDDQMNLLVASKYLKTSEELYTFQMALNGEQAIQLFCDHEQRGSPFDVIFMDCNMPIMDGYEATKKLRNMMKSNKIRWTPIVGLTGNTTEVDKKRCHEAGMDFVLCKPYKKSELFLKIQEALAKKEHY